MNSQIENNSDLAVSFTGDVVQISSFSDVGEIHTKTFLLDSSLHENLKSFRDDIGQVLNLDTVVHLSETVFTAYTKLIRLPDETFKFSDEELNEWLIEAASNGTVGGDGFPIFDRSLDQAAYDYVRISEQFIVLTEIPREFVRLAIRRVIATNLFDEREVSSLSEDLPEDLQPVFRHFLETKIRCIARYFLWNNEHSNDISSETIIFLTFSRSGAAVALWNPEHKLYYEIGEFFRSDETDEGDTSPTDIFFNECESFLYSQVYNLLYPDGEPLSVSHIYAVTDPGAKSATGAVRHFADEFEIPFVPVEISSAEAVNIGALLLSDEESAGMVPPLNLAFGLLEQQEAREFERQNEKAIAARRSRRSAVLFFVVPSIVISTILLGLYFSNFIAERVLADRLLKAETEKTRLAPVLSQRAAYEKTLNWYEDLIKQIVQLKTKQSLAISFPANLNRLYPGEYNLFVNNLKLETGGTFEIKGVATDKDSITQFVRALEFASNETAQAVVSENITSDRIFSNLRFELKETDQKKTAEYLEFTVNGNYLPMQKIRPSTQVIPSANVSDPLASSPPPPQSTFVPSTVSNVKNSQN